MSEDFFARDPATFSIEENWNWFKTSILSVVNDLVPHKRVSGSSAPWFNSKMKRLCRKKEKAYIRAKKSNSAADWDRFCTIRKQVDRSLRDAHRQYVHRVAESEDPAIHQSQTKR